MFHPSFSTSKTGVPILSGTRLETIGEQVMADYCPGALNEPEAIDVDRFLTRYLGVKQDFKYLSHCGLYLGMTVFQDCQVPVFNPDLWQAEMIAVEGGTVIIDNCLLEDNQEHRYRFTAAHEGAHLILHRDYYEHRIGACAALENTPMVQCRYGNDQSPPHGSGRPDSDWLEWQANRLASILLMPKNITMAVAAQAEKGAKRCNAGLEAVAKTFNVSTHAAYFRLKQIGFIKNKR